MVGFFNRIGRKLPVDMNTDIFSGTKKTTHLSGFFCESWSGKRDSYLVSDSLKSKDFVFLQKQEKT